MTIGIAILTVRVTKLPEYMLDTEARGVRPDVVITSVRLAPAAITKGAMADRRLERRLAAATCASSVIGWGATQISGGIQGQLTLFNIG